MLVGNFRSEPGTDWKFFSLGKGFVAERYFSYSFYASDFLQIVRDRLGQEGLPALRVQHSSSHFSRCIRLSLEERNSFNVNSCFFQQASGQWFVRKGDLESGGLGQQVGDPDHVEFSVGKRRHNIP